MDAHKRCPGIDLSDTDAGRFEARPVRVVIGRLVILAAFAVYVASSWRFDAGRLDRFYLADTFIRGRLRLDRTERNAPTRRRGREGRYRDGAEPGRAYSDAR